jgi:hypothetical protein
LDRVRLQCHGFRAKDGVQQGCLCGQMASGRLPTKRESTLKV